MSWSQTNELTAPADFLQANGVSEAIAQAVATVLRERPDDPKTRIGELLLAHAAAATAKSATAAADPRGLVDTAPDTIDEKTATFARELSAGIDFSKLASISLKKAGLSAVPAAIGSCVAAEKLELSLNPKLSTLPEEVSSLQRVRILFALGCSFTTIPPCLAKCGSLYMLSFKSNKLTSIAENALAPSIEWLILTDNQLTSLPSSLPLGVRKFMLTNNKLTALPDTILNCKDLELIRLADNRLTALPQGMLSMPKLSWMGLAGNPLVARGKAHELPPPVWIAPSELIVGERLGAGGGGFVHRAMWAAGTATTTAQERPEAVAIKIFRDAGTVTDGDPRHEIDLGSALQHDNVIRVIGASSTPRLGLVLELLDVQTTWCELGKPPNFDTCTRDTYAEGTSFSVSEVLATLRGVALACTHLHGKGFTHGDLYAHNTLVRRGSGDAKVGDFGAAYFYPPLGEAAKPLIERIEVRAFGCMAEELRERMSAGAGEGVVALLGSVVAACMAEDVMARPNFAEVVSMLAGTGGGGAKL